MKKLTDWTRINELRTTLDKIHGEQAQNRAEIQETERRIMQPRQTQNALALFEAGDAEDISRQGLYERLENLRRHENFLTTAEAQAKKALDREVAAASLEICAEHRPQFVSEIKKILAALKIIYDANAKLSALRDSLESEGIRTGSLPHCRLIEIGKGNDGEIADRYQRWIHNNFAEIKEL